MALTSYQQTTRRILGDVGFAKFDDFDLRDWINTARGQVSGEGECVRVYSTLTLAPPAMQYPFSSIVFPSGTTGVQGVTNVRMITYAIPGTDPAGYAMVTPREWEWFNSFVLAQAVPAPGMPRYWAQYGQGANGTLFVNLADLAYTLYLDAVCFPSNLTIDADPDAIPKFWSDAVPYYAAYVALLTAQNAEAAAAMYKLYELFMGRARQMATPSVLPHQYSQAPDAMMMARMATRAA